MLTQRLDEQRPGPSALVDPAALIELVRGRLADILGMPASAVPADRPFEELGVDSILLMELVKSLSRELEVELQATEAYDHDTVERLARLITHNTTVAEPAEAEPAGSDRPEPGSAPADLVPVLVDLVMAVTGRPFDRAVSFVDNGLTSFDMLQVVSVLEKPLGSLPKTLLFDRPGITELAAFLADEQHLGHADVPVLTGRRPEPGAAAPRLDELITGARIGAPSILVKRRLGEQPGMAELLTDLDERFAQESGLAGRDIAPLAFLGSRRTAYFNFSMRDTNLLAWSYVGSDGDFPELAGEWVSYARGLGLNPNFLALMPLSQAGGSALTATPFGALQRLQPLGTFSLAGGRMSRLRYLVRHVEQLGASRTVEYRSGSDPGIDRQIAEMIDKWASTKEMINPYVSVVRAEVAAGRLAPRYRPFLTYLDDVLANVVIVTDLPASHGYLLDLEFYPPDMPLGGLDYAIYKIIELLAAEGCDVFSFGASFGVSIGDSSLGEPEVERGLAELRSAGIFDEGNFRFKNKFRPQNIPIYLCRPANGDRTSISDVILMIADPDLGLLRDPPAGSMPARGAAVTGQAAVEPGPVAAVPEQAAAVPDQVAAVPVRVAAVPGPVAAGPDRRRLAVLTAHHYDVAALPAVDAGLDLSRDDWWEAAGPPVADRMAELATPGSTPDPQWIGRRHVIMMAGPVGVREALSRCWHGRRGAVVRVDAGPGWLQELTRAGFSPTPDLGLSSTVDLPAVAAALAAPGPVSFLVIGLGGGVGPDTLRRLRETARQHGTAVVLDATRLVGTAVRLTAGDPAGRALGPIVAELLGTDDVVMIDMAGEYAVPFGALLATDDSALAARIDAHLLNYGRGLSRGTRRWLGTAAADLDGVARRVGERGELVDALRARLLSAGLPVVVPGSGHDVVLDLGALPGFARHEQRVASALAWIYLWAGVRAASVPSDAQDRLVRFAVPLGTPPEQLTAAADRLASLTAVPDIPDLNVVHGAGDAGFHPREGVPADIQEELAAGYRPRDDNWAVLREHQPQVRRDLLSVGGADVEVFSAGAGPVLLLMHPFNIGAGVFAAQFAELAQLFRLVCVQHPGVGRSTIGDELSLEAIVRTDRAALRELGCTEPVHLVGSSFGSLTALRFVLDHPADVASLMLIGGSATLGDRATEVNRLDVVAERDLTSAVEGSRSRRLRRDRDRHRDHLLRCESMDPYTGLRYLDVFADPPRFEPRLGEVRVPTRIVHGRFDTVVPIQQARLLTSGIPQARLEEVRDAGHFPMVTCTTALNALITGFLIDQARPGPARVLPTPVAAAGRGV